METFENFYYSQIGLKMFKFYFDLWPWKVVWPAPDI